MSRIEYTTVANDWTSGVLLDMTTANDSSGSPSTVDSTYKPDTDMVVFVIMTSVIGLVLNVAALVVLLQKRNRQITTNHYLVMLAVGDIMMCTIIAPLRLMHEYRAVWWSREGCIVHEALKHGPLLVSINTVVLIAIERWVAVVWPAKFSAFASPRNVKIQLGLVWLLALVQLIFPMAIVKVARLPDKNYCTIFYLKSAFVYVFMCMVAVPLAFLIITYGSIIVTVLRRRWNSRATSEMRSTSGGKEQAEPCRQRLNTRLIVVCAVITVLFMACWMPVFTLMYLRLYYRMKINSHFVHYVHVIFYCHPILNPCVYFFVDARFRAKFVRLFCRKQIDGDNISMASVTEVVTAHQ